MEAAAVRKGVAQEPCWRSLILAECADAMGCARKALRPRHEETHTHIYRGGRVG